MNSILDLQTKAIQKAKNDFEPGENNNDVGSIQLYRIDGPNLIQIDVYSNGVNYNVYPLRSFNHIEIVKDSHIYFLKNAKDETATVDCEGFEMIGGYDFFFKQLAPQIGITPELYNEKQPKGKAKAVVAKEKMNGGTRRRIYRKQKKSNRKSRKH